MLCAGETGIWEFPRGSPLQFVLLKRELRQPGLGQLRAYSLPLLLCYIGVTAWACLQCGFISGDKNVEIPAWLLGPTPVCSCGSPSCCSPAPAGPGSPNTDYVLFVTAANTGSCGGSTLAYALACQRDEFDKPTVGRTNICPSKIPTDPSEVPRLVGTVAHEVIHALGFSRSSWWRWWQPTRRSSCWR